MNIITSADQARCTLNELKTKGYTIGFVPTLGGLHKGHQLLMQRSCEENDITVISIFLNPLQFRKQQFLAYPSDFNQDQRIATESKVDIIFHPSVAEMYPHNDFFFGKTDDLTHRDPEKFIIDKGIMKVSSNLVNRLDGKMHPWVFDGAATIVHKFLGLLQPNRAYFGEKDFQQLAILTKMARIYFPHITIVGIPTLRDTDGLAFSSRNVLLSNQQRQSALSVCHALKQAKRKILAGETTSKNILNLILKAISPEITIDYIEIITQNTLAPVIHIHEDIVLYVAFFINSIRLTETLIVNR